MITQNRQPYLKTRHDVDFQFFGSPTVLHAAGETTDGRFCLMEHATMPPGLASPYHRHHNEDEAFYVLEGHVRFVCDGRWLDAGPGTWVYGPREIPHGFKVVGPGPARMLLMCAPAGFEKFALELCAPLDAVPAPPEMSRLMHLERDLHTHEWFAGHSRGWNLSHRLCAARGWQRADRPRHVQRPARLAWAPQDVEHTMSEQSRGSHDACRGLRRVPADPAGAVMMPAITAACVEPIAALRLD